MSPAKRAVRNAIAAWLEGAGPAPRLLRRCEVCGDESWRPLPRGIRSVTVNATLPDGRRADLVCWDAGRRPRLVVQLFGPSRLRDRSETGAGAPLVVVAGAGLVEEPLRLRALRERGLPKWGCRCARARELPVDDGFSLRVIGCPLGARRHGTGGGQASVIHDCGHCACFVGIGYSDPERRRVSLYCSHGAVLQPRLGPLPSGLPRYSPTARLRPLPATSGMPAASSLPIPALAASS